MNNEQIEQMHKADEKMIHEVARIETVPLGLPVVTQSPATPADIVLYAMKNGGSIEQIREFMQLQREWEADQARKAFVAAKAAFKAETIVVHKDKENKQYDSRYTSLGNLVNTVSPFLSKHGLSADWTINQDGGLEITCILSHAMGHSDRVSFKVPPDTAGSKNLIQQMKSAITYAKGVTFESVCGLAATDANLDDDGKGAALDVALADKWMRRALHAADLTELEQVWKDGEAEIKATGTEYDYKDFVGAVNARKAKLSAPPREANKSSRLNDIVGKGAAPQQAAE